MKSLILSTMALALAFTFNARSADAGGEARTHPSLHPPRPAPQHARQERLVRLRQCRRRQPHARAGQLEGRQRQSLRRSAQPITCVFWNPRSLATFQQATLARISRAITRRPSTNSTRNSGTTRSIKLDRGHDRYRKGSGVSNGRTACRSGRPPSRTSPPTTPITSARS